MTPTTIRPSVSPEVINKVTRLFNGSLDDLVNEMLQNARRAGATRIAVTLDTSDDGSNWLAFDDNGSGISDPQDFISLGKSHWNAETIASEDPAGMGVYALAPRRAVVVSADHTQAGWTATINPDAWTGQIDIPVAPVTRSHGTMIAVQITADEHVNAQRIVAKAATFHPVPVTFEELPIVQSDFLADCETIVETDAYRIGVKPFKHYEPTTNFHGLTINQKIFEVSLNHGITYAAYVDILCAPELKLVLPARKEYVKDQAFIALQLAAEQAIYQHIATLPEHTLSYKNYTRALALDVDIAPAARRLRTYFPPTAADGHEHLEFSKSSEAKHLVIVGNLAPPIAWHITDALKESHPHVTPCHREPAYAGYTWYDDIPLISDAGAEITIGAVTVTADCDAECTNPNYPFGEPQRADAIAITYQLTYPATRESQTFRHSVNQFCLYSDPLREIEETDYFVTKISTPQASEALAYFEACLFDPSQDSDSDSWDTQQSSFTEDAIRCVYPLIYDDDTAIAAAVQHTLRAAYLQVPAGMTLTATITSGSVRVEVATPRERTPA
jgi:hypothetical protein